MVAIGSYFAFITIVMGTLVAQDIDNEDRISFSKGILYVHNTYRRIHGVSALKLNEELNKKANEYVKEWASNKRATIPDIYGVNYAQQCFKGSKSKLQPKTIVSSWYKAIKDYDHTKEPSSSEKIGSFTQLVWRDTQEIGVGILIKNGEVYVIVIYSPAGNQLNQYMSNVTNPQELDKQEAELGKTSGKKTQN